MMAESVDATVKETPPARARARPAALRPVRGLDGAARCRATSAARSATASPSSRTSAAVCARASSSPFFAMTISRASSRSRSASSSAIRRNTAVDRVGATFALFGICMPNFLLALLLIFFFGVTLRWLPISGYTDPLEEPWNGLRSLALPADHARAGPGRRGHAHPALEPARGAGRGLRPHRPRQGALGVAGHLRPRAQERADPGRHRARAAARHADRRRGHHRIRLRAARRRAASWSTRSSRATTRSCRASCC